MLKLTRSVGRRGLSLSLAVMLLAALPGCATFYLHSAATQKQTDSARSALDAIKTDSIFDSEAAYLDKLQVEEDAAVTAELAARRDQDILLVINGPGPGTGPGIHDGLTTLKNRIDGYLETLVGATDAHCDLKLWRVVDVDLSRKWDTASDLQLYEKQISQRVADIKARCVGSPVTALPVPSAGPNFAVAAQVVIADLDMTQQLTSDSNSQEKDLKTALADLQSKMSAGKPVATDVSADLSKVQGALSSANPYIRKYISAALSSDVAATIDALSPPGAGPQPPMAGEARSGIAVMQALFSVGDAYASPPRVPHPNALAAGQSWLNYAAAQATVDLQNQELLQRDHQAQFAAVLAEIYYLSKAGEQIQLNDKLARRPPGPGTVGLGDMMDPKDPQLVRAINGAVMYYGEAWTRGFTADVVASRRTLIDQRRGDLAVGRVAAAAWMGSLKPAVLTLDSYGAGGLDPQILARLIQSLGLGAIAVGVNK